MSNIFNQEGELESPKDISRDHLNKLNTWFMSEKKRFEEALQERCTREGSIFSIRGFDRNSGIHFYQIDNELYGVKVQPSGIQFGQFPTV